MLCILLSEYVFRDSDLYNKVVFVKILLGTCLLCSEKLWSFPTLMMVQIRLLQFFWQEEKCGLFR